jgi:hypothetical protein
VVKIKETRVSSMSAQSLRELIKHSIETQTPATIEMTSGGSREVAFKKFLKKSCAVGTTDNGTTTVVVLIPSEEQEATSKPVVVLGHS